MIMLDDRTLLFQLASGEFVPFSAEMISVELAEGGELECDQDFIHHAAATVFHYFKKDLVRKSVTVAEFATAFEAVLNGFGLKLEDGRLEECRENAAVQDLQMLALHAGQAGELAFFPRLRTAVHSQFLHTPRLVRFRGLRGCVKQLAGVARWSGRCDRLQDQIIDYLEQSVRHETAGAPCALVVE